MSSLEQPTTRIPAGGGDGGGTVILDRYELTGQIGRGGFSTVYRAWDRKMQRQVAVKAVRRTEELTGRAAHEAKAAAKLSHPHIVTVFELAEDTDGANRFGFADRPRGGRCGPPGAGGFGARPRARRHPP